MTESKRFVPPFLVLMSLGLCGVITLFFVARATPEFVVAAELAGQSVDRLALFSLVPPVILLIVAVAVGTWLAPIAGLRSHIVDLVRGRRLEVPRLVRDVAVGVPYGAGLALIVLGLAAISSDQSFTELPALQPRGIEFAFLGVLYGGITEELMMRYGGVTLAAWVFWRLTGRKTPTPGRRVMWSAIALLALLFGLGHLPAAALNEPLTIIASTRIVILTGMAGFVLGWLYWRRSLEAAMAAHAAANLIAPTLAVLIGSGSS